MDLERYIRKCENILGYDITVERIKSLYVLREDGRKTMYGTPVQILAYLGEKINNKRRNKDE